MAAFVDMDAIPGRKDRRSISTVSRTRGKCRRTIITSNNYANSQPTATGLKQEFSQDCPSCKLTYANVNGPDWATKIQPLVSAALTRDPNLNFVIPVFDRMLEYVVPAVTTKGAIGKVRAGSWNGTPAILDLIRTGKMVPVDVGENPADIAAASLDQSMRVMLDVTPWRTDTWFSACLQRPTSRRRAPPPRSASDTATPTLLGTATCGG